MRGYKGFDSDPHPGDLHTKIKIGKNINKPNENGFPTTTEEIICTAWAAIVDAGNEKYRDSDMVNVQTVLNFAIRYRDDIEVGMWVLYEGTKWYISNLNRYNFRRTYLGIKASLVEGVEGVSGN